MMPRAHLALFAFVAASSTACLDLPSDDLLTHLIVGPPPSAVADYPSPLRLDVSASETVGGFRRPLDYTEYRPLHLVRATLTLEPDGACELVNRFECDADGDCHAEGRLLGNGLCRGWVDAVARDGREISGCFAEAYEAIMQDDQRRLLTGRWCQPEWGRCPEGTEEARAYCGE